MKVNDDSWEVKYPELYKKKDSKVEENLKVLNENLYEKYYVCLGKRTQLKNHLNSTIKRFLSSNDRKEIMVEECIKEYKKESKIGSDEFYSNLKRVIREGVDKVAKFGCVPYTYIPMGTSPRIMPMTYGNTINNTKKIVRDLTYNIVAKQAFVAYKTVILDLDLVSCFMSILLGLHPVPLEALQKAIEGKGLWEYIRIEFEKAGCLSAYNKAAVKICVYSAFFGGGTKGMIQGIMDSFRKDAGLTEDQFKESSFYFECKKIATDVAAQMDNSSVILDIRDIAKTFKESHPNAFLSCPTGQKYLLSEHNFNSNYANFLMSYEFSLLANGVLNTLKKYPQMEVIGHYHDGVVVTIPVKLSEDMLAEINYQLKIIGDCLKLAYPQVIVCKQVYPDEEKFSSVPL